LFFLTSFEIKCLFFFVNFFHFNFFFCFALEFVGYHFNYILFTLNSKWLILRVPFFLIFPHTYGGKLISIHIFKVIGICCLAVFYIKKIFVLRNENESTYFSWNGMCPFTNIFLLKLLYTFTMSFCPRFIPRLFGNLLISGLIKILKHISLEKRPSPKNYWIPLSFNGIKLYLLTNSSTDWNTVIPRYTAPDIPP